MLDSLMDSSSIDVSSSHDGEGCPECGFENPPGNWEFGYGPAVSRNRFTSFGPKPGLPANIQVMAAAVDCGDVPVIAGVVNQPRAFRETGGKGPGLVPA